MQLYAHYERALAASKLGEQERQTLLAIAEKLRIAAETFSAFRTGKKLELDSLALRDQALSMAALLEPVAQVDAACIASPLMMRLTPQATGSFHPRLMDQLAIEHRRKAA
jgi:hypothetical protein